MVVMDETCRVSTCIMKNRLSISAEQKWCWATVSCYSGDLHPTRVHPKMASYSLDIASIFHPGQNSLVKSSELFREKDAIWDIYLGGGLTSSAHCGKVDYLLYFYFTRKPCEITHVFLF